MSSPHSIARHASALAAAGYASSDSDEAPDEEEEEGEEEADEHVEGASRRGSTNSNFSGTPLSLAGDKPGYDGSCSVVHAPLLPRMLPSGVAWTGELVAQCTKVLLEQLVGIRGTSAPLTSKFSKILSLPFPIAVFGTLRLHHSNNWFMGLPCSDAASVFTMEHVDRDQTIQRAGAGRMPDNMARPRFCYWAPAAINDLSCDVLRLIHQPSSSLMAEVFHYTSDEFQKGIGPIDALESFRPPSPAEESEGRSSQRFCGGYVRTLCWVSLLPWDVHKCISHELSQPRTWPQTLCTGYQFRIPCWVYSSVLVNSQLVHSDSPRQPVIWCPHNVRGHEGMDCCTL